LTAEYTLPLESLHFNTLLEGSIQQLSLDRPPCADHVFAAVQAYRFAPAGAAVMKNISPTAQFAGSAVPALNGLVEFAAVKSMLFACVRRSICV
jgi:hypothetical protein